MKIFQLLIALFLFHLHAFASENITTWEGPDFLVIGAPKCGTGSIFRYIAEHPLVLRPEQKEIHFFDRDFRYQNGKGLSWYQDQFPVKLDPNEKIFEATPSYLYHSNAPKAISKHFPQIKLIILIRDPTERVWSQYKFRLRKGRESRSFSEIIERDLETFEQHLKKNIFDQKDYLVRGIYLHYIKMWRKYFPKEQILILFSKDLLEQTNETINKLYQFVGLHPHQLEELLIYNSDKEKIPLDLETKEFLKEFYRPYNDQLRKYLQKEFSLELPF